MERENVLNFVHSWNNIFWIDRWWREKYKIPFLSPSHKEANFIDMLIEWEEDILYKESLDKYIKEKKNESIENELYIPGTGNWLKDKNNNELSDEDYDKIQI